jgi:hypothetical protein
MYVCRRGTDGGVELGRRLSFLDSTATEEKEQPTYSTSSFFKTRQSVCPSGFPHLSPNAMTEQNLLLNHTLQQFRFLSFSVSLNKESRMKKKPTIFLYIKMFISFVSNKSTNQMQQFLKFIT